MAPAAEKEFLTPAVNNVETQDPDEGGHYITVWALRQTGKTWTMQQILFRLQQDPRFDVLKINLEILKDTNNPGDILEIIARKIG